MPATPATAQAATGCMDEDIVNMIKTLNGAIAAISRDTACIQKAYEQLRAENVARDKALADLAEIVKEMASHLQTGDHNRCCEKMW